jgi:tRNA(Glu) U13 pseudouridine synthase TruD
MKLKCVPEDFQVEEQIALRATGGPFALFRLTKQSLNARSDRRDLAAVGFAAAAAHVCRPQNKHALTTQYVTIRGGRGAACHRTCHQYVY